MIGFECNDMQTGQEKGIFFNKEKYVLLETLTFWA